MMTLTWEKKHWKHRFNEDKASWEAQRLFNRVKELSQYFEDMWFTKNTPTYEMLSIKSKSNLPHPQAEHELPFDLDDCLYIVEPIRGNRSGKFSPSNFSLTIAPSFFSEIGDLSDEQEKDRDNAILHEMIHMYEFALDEYTEKDHLYHEILLYCLYKDLRLGDPNKVPNLDEIIHQKGNLANLKRIREIGGEHDLLFLLKSIDLDLQVGADVGTIFFY